MPVVERFEPTLLHWQQSAEGQPTEVDDPALRNVQMARARA